VFAEIMPSRGRVLLPTLSGERTRELGPCKSVRVKEEHEIAASGAQPPVERGPLPAQPGGSARPARAATPY
jgi:hypothetical protein